MWHEIKNNEDINNFLDSLGSLYDAVLREIKYNSGAYATEDGLVCSNSARELSVILQPGFNVKAVELVFHGLRQLRLSPLDPGGDCILWGCTMYFKDDLLYWADDGETDPEDECDYAQTWIVAESARWRVANNYIGEGPIYVNRIEASVDISREN